MDKESKEHPLTSAIVAYVNSEFLVSIANIQGQGLEAAKARRQEWRENLDQIVRARVR